MGNYSSMLANPLEAAAELNRFLEQGFGIRISREHAMAAFADGSFSRLALILKTRLDGTSKARIIVDMLRSGANSRSFVPERIVLPRVCDVTVDVKDLAETEQFEWGYALQAQKDTDGRTAEFFTADFKDAYMHYM
eukprot:3886261-Heterocapsa_arctica.AAC.1